jgi:hypothetical protein
MGRKGCEKFDTSLGLELATDRISRSTKITSLSPIVFGPHYSIQP